MFPFQIFGLGFVGTAKMSIVVFKVTVAAIALATLNGAANFKRVTCPDGKNTASHEAIRRSCSRNFVGSILSHSDDLQVNLYENVCGETVYESLRLTFHDAIGFSTSGEGHGTDGSMVIFDSIETAFAANNGIDESVDALTPFLQRHKVTAGALIQFAGAVGLTNCPGAPRLEFLASTAPFPNRRILSIKILARMADADFSPKELIHLLASHTVARSDHIDPTIQQVPFNTIPFTFDTQIFLEVLLKCNSVPGTSGNIGEALSPLGKEGEMRLQSDFALARDSRTACEWQSMVDKFGNNQKLMVTIFKNAMAKMAVTGQDKKKLIDCSEVTPVPKPPVAKPATFPAGTRNYYTEAIGMILPLTIFKCLAGAPTHIPACPNGAQNSADCPTPRS
ncbi:heme peroxidase [Rickenella mellea]|uniref:Peroxidase n=1 Tax=Rickenella mellea TaxID=50990 RepID=A0A4Y7PG48_9AGAM|nr:heme peroxidase [Rickenella mellea]